MKVITLSALCEKGELRGKRVLIRSDLNVPMNEDGVITNETRIVASLPAIRMALEAGAGVMVMSHLGRPKEGQAVSGLDSLSPIAARLSALLGVPVPLVTDYLDGVKIEPGQVVLLENCRANVGEKSNDAGLAKRYADLCDVFVNDAFGTAHRAQASTVGVAEFAKVVCAGPLMAEELDALTQSLGEAKRPLVAIVGGSKVSTKLTILDNLAKKVDQLIVGGGILNTFLLARGFKVGTSLVEPDLVAECQRVTDTLKMKGIELLMPEDVVVAKAFAADAPHRVASVRDVQDDEMILDVGPKAAAQIAAQIKAAKTIVWNGPLGVFEMAPYAGGTRVLAEAIAASTDEGAFSIAGGGDTVSAVSHFNIAERVSYISTGGGAFLEFLEGKVLPAVDILEKRAQ